MTATVKFGGRGSNQTQRSEPPVSTADEEPGRCATQDEQQADDEHGGNPAYANIDLLCEAKGWGLRGVAGAAPVALSGPRGRTSSARHIGSGMSPHLTSPQPPPVDPRRQ